MIFQHYQKLTFGFLFIVSYLGLVHEAHKGE